ncbi:hypothetical protein [Cetobacterium sp.]
MNKKIVILLSTITLFTACSSLKSREYVGTYTYGHEVEIFTDEKTGQEYWINGKSNELNQYMSKLVQEGMPYPKVKIKIRGIDKGKAKNELAEKDDRVLEILKYEILN